MPTRSLCLDLDGPLLDVRARYHGVYTEIARELGAAPLGPEEYWRGKRLRRPLVSFFPGAAPGPALRTEYLRCWLTRIETPEWLARDVTSPGAVAGLEALGSMYSLHLLTLRRDQVALEHQLDSLGLRKRFVAIHAGWTNGPEPYRLKEGWLRALPDVRAMVGDLEVDMLAAAAASVPAIGVSFGIRDGAYLQSLGAFRIVDDLRQLPALLAEEWDG